MAQVFISHARADRPHAEELAEWLENQGWTVWWDSYLLGGSTFRSAIAAELAAAECVIVLWSSNSTSSHWVADEAQSGADRGILLPLLLDNADIPLGFRQFQTVNLPGSWQSSNPLVSTIRASVVAIAGPPSIHSLASEPDTESDPPSGAAPPEFTSPLAVPAHSTRASTAEVAEALAVIMLFAACGAMGWWLSGLVTSNDLVRAFASGVVVAIAGAIYKSLRY